MWLIVPGLVVLGFAVHTVLLEMVAYPTAAALLYPGHPNGRDLVIALQGWVAGGTLLTVTSLTGFAIWRIGKSLDPDAMQPGLLFLPLQTWGKVVAGFGVLFLVLMLLPDAMVDIKRERFVDQCGDRDMRLNAQGCSCMRSRLESLWPVELYIPFYAVAEDYLRDPAKGDQAMRRLEAWYEAKPGVSPGQVERDLAAAMLAGFECRNGAGERRPASDEGGQAPR